MAALCGRPGAGCQCTRADRGLLVARGWLLSVARRVLWLSCVAGRARAASALEQAGGLFDRPGLAAECRAPLAVAARCGRPGAGCQRTRADRGLLVARGWLLSVARRVLWLSCVAGRLACRPCAIVWRLMSTPAFLLPACRRRMAHKKYALTAPGGQRCSIGRRRHNQALQRAWARRPRHLCGGQARGSWPPGPPPASSFRFVLPDGWWSTEDLLPAAWESLSEAGMIAAATLIPPPFSLASVLEAAPAAAAAVSPTPAVAPFVAGRLFNSARPGAWLRLKPSVVCSRVIVDGFSEYLKFACLSGSARWLVRLAPVCPARACLSGRGTDPCCAVPLLHCSKLRLCWDARKLNEQIGCPSFKFETVDVAARLMRPGDYMFVLDSESGGIAGGALLCVRGCAALSRRS